ncbi:hypothetical protein L7F22_054156 [Adiantum nelumboides]|nr:hypothetical protein [Adiantum nelumboides]
MDVVAYAKSRTKKPLKKRQASQGMSNAIVSKSIEAVAVRTQPPVIESLPIVQEEQRVLWLQRDGVTSMSKMSTKEVSIIKEPFESMDKVESTQVCSSMVQPMSLDCTREHRVKFVDEVEEILDLEIEEEVEARFSSSMDTDATWETESSCSRYEAIEILHVDKAMKEDVLEEQGKVQEDVMDTG